MSKEEKGVSLHDEVDCFFRMVSLYHRLGFSPKIDEAIEETTLFLDVLHATQRYFEFKQRQGLKEKENQK